MLTSWKKLLKFSLPVMLVTLLSCASAFSMADNHQTTEYKIKAAFLYNFSRFIDWPDEVRRENDKFILCILGSDPFGGLLDTLSGKPVEKSSLEIKRFRNLEQSETCQIIYISKTGVHNLEKIMATLKQQPILTVSDIEGFSAYDGIIQFKLVDNKVRFNINIDAANKAGLKISSKLLSLATVVRSGH